MINFVSCFDKNKVNNENALLDQELTKKIQQLNENFKKYHSIDILGKDLESSEDYLNFMDSVNELLKHNFLTRTKKAFVKSRADTITLNDVFWANALLSGNSTRANKKLVLRYENKSDTINFDPEFEVYSFKIKPIKKGVNKFDGWIYEDNLDYMFHYEFYVK